MVQMRHKSGFTLIEILVVLTVILVVAGMLWKMGHGLEVQNEVQKQKEAFAILDSALQAYYEAKGVFPEMVVDDDLDELVLPQARTETMWQRLLSVPESRFIAERLSSDCLKTLYLSDDEQEEMQEKEKDPNAPFEKWPEVYDVWGHPVDYQWEVDTAFPILKSLGPNADPNAMADDMYNR